MILIAGGDSFVFGAELKDQINGPSQSTYTALLAKENKMIYRCVAWPGNANNAISRMTLAACTEALKTNSNIGVIVTWSFANRYEFRFNYPTGHKISPWHTVNAWSTIDNFNEISKDFKSFDYDILYNQKKDLLIGKKTGTSKFAKTWFLHVGDSEYYELFSSLKEILFLQLFLEKNNIPFLFLAADNHFYNHPNYFRQRDEYIESMYNQIDWSKWFFFEPVTEIPELRGFYQWAVENKYPIGTTHPLEEAHQAAAELIKEKFNELVTKSLEQNSIRSPI